jgi:hypothetical protein
MEANLVAFLAFVLAAIPLLSRRLRKSPSWRATVTPLASIIGSGFLVSLPLLVTAVGSRATPAIVALCAAAYLLGGAIRFNIRHGEPLFGSEGRYRGLSALERTSHIALAGAYFVSVAYYLALLAAFALKGAGKVDPAMARIVTTAFLAALGLFGMWKGLRGLESLEEYAVGLKLAIIAAVLAALLFANGKMLIAGTWHVAGADPPLTWHAVSVVLGTLIVVQGFETSRFLGGVYDAERRAGTMRLAQLIAGGIYVAFFALAAAMTRTPERGDVAAITEMLASVALIVSPMLITGAVFAQASAAIADAIGATGLLGETVGKARRSRAYLLVALVGIALVWSVDVFWVIAIASRAFALYYALQCVVAARVACVTPDLPRRWPLVAWFLLLALLPLAVLLFGAPAELADG